MATEIELKLRINPDDVPRLRRHPLLKAFCRGRAARRKLFSIYYDTPELALKRQGVALRLRKVGRNWVQTIKGLGEAHQGLHQREEWEARVKSGRPDFDKISDPALRRIFSAAVRERLTPVFVTEFWRTAWKLEPKQGCRVELALDQGLVRSGDAQAQICELEFELQAGKPAVLFELAQVLRRDIPLQEENLSKAARGYALLAVGKPARGNGG